MITKDVYGQYDEFFKQVNDLLKLDGDDIVGDINDYFTVLGDIRDKVTKEGADPYFLILPNDEPLLKIDANTRKIDTKGWEAGIGTQGDELAEIIYFSIDRYFDTADLYDKDIFVQKCLVLKYINHDLYPELNFSEIQDCIDMVIKHKDKLEVLYIDLRIHDIIEEFFDYIHQGKRK